MSKNNTLKLIAIFLFVIVLVLLYGIKIRKNNPQVHVTTTTGNYGRFIESSDSNYFSTHDSNVRNLIKSYLVWSPGTTDADKYGRSLIYYYDSSRFIEAYVTTPNNHSTIFYYTLYNTENGQKIPGCAILRDAGLYKDENILLSASFLDSISEIKEGICMYERGASNFTFIDLTSKLSKDETLFKDPAGQMLTASVTNVDTKQRTLDVGVYSKTTKNASGNYVISRNMRLSF